MRNKNYSRNKGRMKDSVICGAIGLAVSYAAGYVVRGVTYAITETNTWKNKIYPRIERTYNELEDARDNAIDRVKKFINKNKKEEK